MEFTTESVMMPIINKNFSYNDRRSIINVLTESSNKKTRVYSNIGNYFFKRLGKLDIKNMLGKYSECKGDISKFKGYTNMVQALQFLKVDRNPDVSKNAMIVESTIMNLKTRKKNFELGFKSNESSLTRMVFACVTKACVGATSLLINHSSAINGEGLNSRFEHMVFNGLEVFNTCCKNGTADKMLRFDLNISGKYSVKESIFGDTISLGVSVGSALITAIRSLVYWVYYTRMDLADYLEQQAAYIEVNKVALENRKDLDANKKKEIIRKQTEWQQTLLKWSDEIQLDDVKAARKAKAEAEKDLKEMTPQDVTVGTDEENDEPMPDFF